MTLSIAPYDDLAAIGIFRNLDPDDMREAQALRGMRAAYPQLFAEWHSVQSHAVLSVVLQWVSGPFAVLILGNTGQAGVAQAAMVAKDHRVWRRGLLAAGQTIRREMPGFCTQHGIHRVEARAWAQHPRAGRFLRLCGFRLEAEMTGFGADGAGVFHQYAWTA